MKGLGRLLTSIICSLALAGMLFPASALAVQDEQDETGSAQDADTAQEETLEASTSTSEAHNTVTQTTTQHAGYLVVASVESTEGDADEDSETTADENDIANATVTLDESSYTYTGNACTPAVSVVLGGVTLVEGSDYTLAYADNVSSGTASVTVTGTGSYTGSQTVTFTIAAATTKTTTKRVTYKLSISATTKKTSSGNAAVRTVRVTKPTLVTTTKTTTTLTDDETGEVVSTTTKTQTKRKRYGLNVQVNAVSAGWKKATLNDAGTTYVYKAASGSYVQAVKLTPSNALKSALKTAGLNLYYKVNSKTFGALGWAKAGQKAGSLGQQRAITKLTVKAAAKIPGSSKRHFISKPSVTYKVKYKKSSKWTSAKKNGATAGTESWSVATSGLAVKISGSSYTGCIKYSVRYDKSDASSKWTGWSSNYKKLAKNKNVQAVRVKLTGDIASRYNVYYRVYAGDHHWLGWAKNGQKAGTKNINYPIGALEIRLQAKGVAAPGSTASHFVSTIPATGGELTMLRKAQGFTSSTSYLILVDRNACRVGVFTGSKNNWKLKHFWKCTPGASSSPTITGTYTVGGKGYSFGTSSYTCYYYTQISGNYLFHSVLYYAGTRTVKDGRLGQHLSHGCIRLAIANAKWLYDTVPRGSKIYIYN